MKEKFASLACSNCFIDAGLKLDAARLGIKDISNCTNCGSVDGMKLDSDLLHDLAFQYFVQGASFRTEYGGAPPIQYNEYHFGQDDLNVPAWLENDLMLLGKMLRIGFFHYGPRLWTLGEIVPLQELQRSDTREKVIKKILAQFPSVLLPPKTSYYRLRKNPETPSASSEYDTPPDEFLGTGRLDSTAVPVLYASQDLEACVHECRVTVEDALYVGSISLTREITLLDLTAEIHEEETEFESLQITIHFLFSAASHSYEILRDIAKAARVAEFDGILYPSYFSQVHRQDETVKNVAIFGRPIAEVTVTVDCIDRVILKKVIYDIHFGPADF